MALDAHRRPQQPPMQFMHHDPVGPQFTNPWTQSQMQNAAAGLHSLGKPQYRDNDASYMNPPTAALGPNNMRNLSPSTGSYTSAPSMMSAVTGVPTFSSAEMTQMTMAPTSAPSPTTCGATYVPSISTSFDHSVPSRTISPERRLSHPTLSNPLYLGADLLAKPRQASLTDFTYRPPRHDLDFNTMDSARNMVVMSQSIPRPRQDSTSSAYPSTHSASSSISSSHSFPYYNGAGSVDSSATEYSDNGNTYSDHTAQLRQPMPTLPLPRQGFAAPVPNQMMTTFSSRITSSTQKKHKCKVCDKRFTRPSSLQTHTYSHTGEKPFACEHQGCGRRFSVVSNLRRHKKVHQGKGQTA
ncbi:hypothetical protein EX30DRAFT_348254 [Ascodesmis nigricans]|uniref:C2H2-type domain-containing protein n=1 Tax=Ascodesmis nigricans TaxID=341454 RepID=A0A4S2MYN7_9PEZI|nr:hypothetical protein EX30DRAFT_348254 [Ascodesmis nigricans]